MNLATRCLPCGTVFRVGESQLLASDGWVRCGRCNSVFNAAEVLFDSDTGTPMRLDLPPSGAAPGPAATAEAAGPVAAGRVEPGFDPRAAPRTEADGPFLRAPSREQDDSADDPIFITDHVPPPAARLHDMDDGPALASASASASELTPAPAPRVLAQQQPATPADPQAAAARVPAQVATGAARPTAALAPLQAQAPVQAAVQAPLQAAPRFMRQAERAARWHQPAVRAGLWAGVVALALAAALQMALLWRDTLAAHLPGTAPALQAACQLAGCSVQPLRRIQLLSVDSSGLNRLDGSSLYRLQLVLRNRADTAVMVPALDLTLTGPQGELVARRVLPMAELGVQQSALQAGQDLPIKVLVSTGERRVDGYTLELFYP